MSCSVGQIVRAKAGRDKNNFFVVVGVEGEFAFIADGKRRKVDNPKKKKFIHLEITDFRANNFSTNREIKKALSEAIKNMSAGSDN